MAFLLVAVVRLIEKEIVKEIVKFYPAQQGENLVHSNNDLFLAASNVFGEFILTPPIF